jgi:RNA polymerase sigma factor (sigma-70 family)
MLHWVGCSQFELEGKLVCNPAYIPQEYEPSFVAEKSPLENIQKTERLELADEEIAAIRVVLQKLAILRVFNIDDVEDLVQDTLLTLIAKPPASELEKGLLVWSLGILRNKVGNYYRKPNRHIPLDKIESSGVRWIPQPLSAASPEADASHTELRTLVCEKVSQLPSPQREVMELLVSGLESHEIVSKLHPERYQNVINWLYRGRKKIAKELARYGYGPGPMTSMKRARGKNRK